MMKYKAESKHIEQAAKDLWSRLDLNKAHNNSLKPSYFYLETFPYPSGTGLHIGHLAGYVPSDVYCRFMRARGYNVIYTMGFDCFGLPAEQFAIETGQHPQITTEQNVANMTKQLKAMGLSYDWDRVIMTSDPEYYKWTQWIFLQMYHSFFDEYGGKAKSIDWLKEQLLKGEWHLDRGVPRKGEGKATSLEEIEAGVDRVRLAYLAEVDVNWCPNLGTVLANEEVINGVSERGSHPVETVKMKQWMLRISAYAPRLSSGFDKIDWPSATEQSQQNWIGKSTGANITFKTDSGKDICVYTTRPDTILGVTYLAAAQDKYPGVTGFTGEYGTHPITKAQVPIWVAEYVLSGYGTGYVMGVPAHDQRDFDFAVANGLPIKVAVTPDQSWLEHRGYACADGYIVDPARGGPFTGRGQVIDLDGSLIEPDDFIKKHDAVMHSKTEYRLRDWIFSRQRYWGEPFPIVYDEQGKVYALDDSELPLELPPMTDFKPEIGATTPTTPLAKSISWVNVEGQIVNGKVITKNLDPAKPVIKFTRETNTMPNWAGSSWYWLRYLDPSNNEHLVDREILNYWTPAGKHATCDMYLIGAEHTVLHLLYARFWNMVLFDLGIVNTPEPFQKLMHQGMITADAYSDAKGHYIDVNDVTLDNGKAIRTSTGEALNIEPGKMGKRYKNGIDPLDLCNKYSVDVVRLHLLYMGPLTQTKTWQNQSIAGMERFCQNVCNMVEAAMGQQSAPIPQMHRLIKIVGENLEKLGFNTAIAHMIEFYNSHKDEIGVTDARTFLQLLSPFAPHLAEHLYQKLGPRCISIFEEPWPIYDEAQVLSDKIKVLIWISGKCKKIIEVDPAKSDADIIADIGHTGKVVIKRQGDKINAILV